MNQPIIFFLKVLVATGVFTFATVETSFAAGASGESPSLDAIALSYLKEKKKTLEGYHLANEHILKTSLACSERLACLADGKKPQSCPRVLPYEITEQYLDGHVEKIQADCNQLLNYYYGITVTDNHLPKFSKRKAKLFQVARLRLAMSSSSLLSDDKRFHLDSEQVSHFLDVTPTSIVPQWTTGFGVPYVEPSPLTPEEIDHAQRYYRRMGEYWASEYIELIKAGQKRTHGLNLDVTHEETGYDQSTGYQERSEAYIKDLNSHCPKRLSDYLLSVATFKDEASLQKNCNLNRHSNRIRYLQRDFARWAYRTHVEEFKKSNLEDHYHLTLKNPLFHQLPDAHLTWQRLRTAFQNMIAASEGSTLSTINDSDDWRDLIDVYGIKTGYSNSEAITLKSKLNIDEKTLQQALTMIAEEYQYHTSVKSYLQIGAVVAAFAACYAPVAKLTVPVAKKVVRLLGRTIGVTYKLGCFYSIGLPLNTYFLYEGISEKKKRWSSALGAADFSMMNQNAQSLSEKDFEIYLHIAFTPLVLKFDAKFFNGLTNKKLLLRAMKEFRRKLLASR